MAAVQFTSPPTHFALTINDMVVTSTPVPISTVDKFLGSVDMYVASEDSVGYFSWISIPQINATPQTAQVESFGLVYTDATNNVIQFQLAMDEPMITLVTGTDGILSISCDASDSTSLSFAFFCRYVGQVV